MTTRENLRKFVANTVMYRRGGVGDRGGGLPSYKSAISCCMHVFNNSEKEFLDNKSVQIQRK